MRIYLEPVNLRQWNLFDNVKGSGHVECFLATRDMQLGDIVILHVGKQTPRMRVVCMPTARSFMVRIFSKIVPLNTATTN